MSDRLIRRSPAPFMKSLLPLLAVLLGLFALPTARAHSAGESSATIAADAENLAVTVSLSLPAASALLPADATALGAATLDAHRATLLAAASRVCVLSDSAEAAIAPQRVLVSVFEEHELRFHFLFAPDARPARLQVPLLSTLRGEAFCVVTDRRLQTPARAILTATATELPLATVGP